MDNNNNNKAWAEAQTRFEAGWRPKRLLGDNTKLAKAEKLGYRNLGLSLAPANISGYEVCASRSPLCTKHCIFGSGKGIFHTVASRCSRRSDAHSKTGVRGAAASTSSPTGRMSTRRTSLSLPSSRSGGGLAIGPG